MSNTSSNGISYEKVAVQQNGSSSSNGDALFVATASVSATDSLQQTPPPHSVKRAFSMEQGSATLTLDDIHDDDDDSDDASDDEELFVQEFSAGNVDMMHGRTTVHQTFIHLLKGYVGPGCLSLPWAVSQLGIPVGIFSIFFVCAWSSYNCRVVVLLKRQYEASLQQQQQHNTNNNHNHHSHITHITYPQLAAWLYGAKMHRFTTLCICVQQLAVCTVFLSFTGTNLQAVFFAVWDVELSHQMVICLALPAVLALSCLPNLKALAPVTFMATVLLMLGFALIGIVISMEWSEHTEQQHQEQSTTNFRNWPTAICAILYSYEGICLVLPVEQAMAPRDAKRHFLNTFGIAMITAATIFATLSYFCVTAFGPITDGSITAFLLQKYGGHHIPGGNNSDYNDNNSNQHGDHLTHDGLRSRFLTDTALLDWLLAANAAVSLSVLITYPLQIFPALELAEPILNPSSAQSRHLRQSADNVGGDRLELIPQHDHDDHDNDNDLDDNANGGYHDDAPQQPQKDDQADNKNKNDENDPTASPSQRPLSETNGLAQNGTARTITTDDETSIPNDGSDDDDDDDDDNVASVKTRVILVLLTFFVAVVVPNVQVLISLAGALAGSSTALLIPPTLEMAWLKKCEQTSSSTGAPASKFTSGLIRCYLLFGLGFLFLCIGTGASLLDIYEAS